MEDTTCNTDDELNIHDKVTELNIQAWDLRYKDPKKALEISRQSFQLAIETGDPVQIMQSRLMKAICNILNRLEIEKIENELLTLNKFFEETHDSKNNIIVTDYLARLYDTYGWYEKAIELAKKALKKLQFLNFPEIKSELFSTLANIYRRLRNYDEALAYYKKAIEIREKLDDEFARASTLNLLARTYSESGDMAKSYLFYHKVLDLRNEINDPAICFTYIGLASNFEIENNLFEAEKMYLKCLESNHQFSNDKICSFLGYSGLGNVYMKTKNFEKAVKMLDIALAYATDTKILVNISKTHLLLSQVYEKLNNLEEALFHLKKYTGLSEQISGKQIDQLKNVELKLKFEELERRNSNTIESIEYAKKIQTAILPTMDLISKVLPEHFILLKPRDIVSGDFYWYCKTKNKIIVCAADCTGHGVPGAFMSMLGISFLNDIVAKDKIYRSDEILNKLREMVKSALQQKGIMNEQMEGMELALCTFDFKRKKLQFSGAKNSLILIRNKELFEFKGDKMPIGIYHKEDRFSSQEIELQPGDTFYLFSDGYVDQNGGEKGRKFMIKNFFELLLEIHHLDMQTQKNILDTTIEKWKSHLNNVNETYEQTDDILVIGLKY